MTIRIKQSELDLRDCADARVWTRQRIEEVPQQLEAISGWVKNRADDVARCRYFHPDEKVWFRWVLVDGVPTEVSGSEVSSQSLASAQRLLAEWKLLEFDEALKKADERFLTDQHKLAPQLDGLTVAEILEVLDFVSISEMPEKDLEVFKDSSHFSAWVRRECNLPCLCDGGFAIHTFEFGAKVLELVLDEEPWVHTACFLRSTNPIIELIGAKLAPRFSAITLRELKPWHRSPLPIYIQEMLIEKIPREPRETLQGWLLVGPPGTSKTTFTIAAVRDWLTLRWMEDLRCRNLSSGEGSDSLHLHVIQVPDWLDEFQGWEHRDFDDRNIRKPLFTPQTITALAKESGVRPILVLEEIDKFSPTANRRQILFRLVDAVYRANGIIVTTANMPLPTLKEQVGDAIYRRIAGDNDAEEAFMVWDFYKALKKKPKPISSDSSSVSTLL